MSTRQRWSPVKGAANRIYDARERRLVAAFDAAGRAWRTLVPRPDPELLASDIRRALVLRLDRIGDVLMSLPALASLRAALPQAHLTLAVGGWSAEIAKSAPVDDVVVWSAPWVGRRDEGADSLATLLGRARTLRSAPPDLAIDLQGDVRANLLLAASGARRRVGYANSGGAWLLDRVVPLDETVSWVEQSRRAVEVALGGPAPEASFEALADADRDFTRRLFGSLGLDQRRPLVGLHPSGGRAIKQWDLARWADVGARLEEEYGAVLLITGSLGDRPLADDLRRRLGRRPIDLTGRLSVRETLAVIAALDLFLSPDTGPMHMACTVGTRSVAVFGPSDPARYFSGGAQGPTSRHVVVRKDLWCAPCNLIRLPPEECARAEGGPECLRLVTPEDVLVPARRLLVEAGFGAIAPPRREGSAS